VKPQRVTATSLETRPLRRPLVVFDFDGLLVNSYAVIRDTLARFGLDVGAEERFRNRRKFLKYLGGGRELVRNLVKIALPRNRQLREALTEEYRLAARVYPELIAVLNAVIADPMIQCGILSRNFALEPGPTIREVLRRSGVFDEGLDFVIPIPVGVHKTEVLAGLRARPDTPALLVADEIGDYRAGELAGYQCLIGTYGFDTRRRLLSKGGLPPEILLDTPAAVADALESRLGMLASVRRPMLASAGDFGIEWECAPHTWVLRPSRA
jgi:phosphoglycolate phosphatase-like HAD superfamily hydrolase